MGNEIELRASRPAWGNVVQLAAFNQNSYALPLSFTRYEPGEIIRKYIELSATQAQQLMDELWDVGVRPTAGKGSAGQLEAVQAHLKDMQRLVFGEYARQTA